MFFGMANQIKIFKKIFVIIKRLKIQDGGQFGPKIDHGDKSNDITLFILLQTCQN